MKYHLKRIIVSFKKLLQGDSKKLNSSIDKQVRLGFHLLIIFSLSFVLIFMFPTDTSLEFSDLKEGNISNRRIVAPFSFEILKTEDEYKKDCAVAEQQVHLVFTYHSERVSEILENINSFFNEVIKVRNTITKGSEQCDSHTA